MITRSQLVAATLGLVVATAAMGQASAATAIKTTVVKSAAVKHTASKPLVRTVHKSVVRVGAPVARHVSLAAHVRRLLRAPSHVTVVKATRTPVHVVKRPLLQKQAMAHRLVVKKTIIR